MSWARWFPLFAGACLLSACGGASFDGRVFRNDELAFRVGPIPPSWRRIELEQALLAFRDDAAHATVAVGGRCGKDGDDVPLEALTQHLFLQFTERQLEAATPFVLDGRGALRSSLRASLDGVPLGFIVVVLKKDGCVYDFLYMARPGGERVGSQDFERFVAGFATLER